MKLHRLEAIRGVAAIYVALEHAVPSRPLILSFGQEAVMMFFLLSGFVIEYSSAHLIHKGFLQYFLKRFLRIYPILICLIIAVILSGTVSISSWDSWKSILGHLMMLQDFETAKPNVIVPTTFSSALWSLHYEWWFYMLYFPVSKYFKKDIQVSAIGITGLISAIIYLIYPNPISRLLLYFPIWWTGVILCRLYVQYQTIKFEMLKRPITYLASIAMILSIPCIQIIVQGNSFKLGIHPFLEFRHLIGSLLVIVIAITWQNFKWIGFSRMLNWGCYVAPISYSFYISHEPLFTNASYLNGLLNPIIEKVVYLIVLLGFCLFSELWVYPRVRNLSWQFMK